MVQEFSVEGNSPFYDLQLEDIGVAKILEMQEYTHEYHMWKIIARGYGSSSIFRKTIWIENILIRRLDRQTTEVLTTSSTVIWRML